RADPAARGRGADRPRARGAAADGAGPLERGDRPGALRQRDDREDSRRPRAPEAEAARPGTGGRVRVRVGPRAAQRRLGSTVRARAERALRATIVVGPKFDCGADQGSGTLTEW